MKRPVSSYRLDTTRCGNGEHNDDRAGLHVCVITYPFDDDVGRYQLSNLLSVLKLLGMKTLVISGECGPVNTEMNPIRIRSLEPGSIISRAFQQVRVQVRICIELVRHRKEYDRAIFFIGAGLVFPILVTKLASKRPIVVLTGMGSMKQWQAFHRESERNVTEFLRLGLSELLERIGYCLGTKLVAYSRGQVAQMGIRTSSRRVGYAREQHVDSSEFRAMSDHRTRMPIVGYVGRLSEEKGVVDLILAAKVVLARIPAARFLICGDGHLRVSVERLIADLGLNESVTVLGWVPHSELPAHMNLMKVIVMPSYSEGLPNSILEAMSCGVVPVVTPVGSLPDIVEDGITGFLINDRSPEGIANVVIMALESPQLAAISSNARALVEGDFTMESLALGWGKILEDDWH